jgi:hypothetical protein
MAIYIEIRKVSEDDASAEYVFRLEGRGEGRLRLIKSTGEVELLETLAGDSAERGFFDRAAHKLQSHWRNGELPEATCWAS